MTRVGLAALLIGACTPSLSVGSPCAQPSDCPSPFACVAGRCRQACATHRDCPVGVRCTAGSDGVQVCALSEGCDASRPCEDGLTCVRGACFDACSTTCPAGGICVDGFCERGPDEPVDAGDAGERDGGTADAPATSARQACVRDTDCGAGRVCTHSNGSHDSCRDVCTSNADCPPSATTVACVEFQTSAGGTAFACSTPCDPLGATSGCLGGDACDVFELWDGDGVSAVIDCRHLDVGMLGQDEVCGDGRGGWDPTVCAAGLTCDGTGPNFTCQQICASALPDCPSGTSCVTLGVEARSAGMLLGSCDPG